MLEFGVNEGLTAATVLDKIKTIETYQGIDVPVGFVTDRPVQRGEVPQRAGHLAKADPRFELIIRLRGSLDLKPTDLKPCDVAFIDGDHGRKGVMHDTGLASVLVRPGGIIIWHDYNFMDVVDVTACLEEMAAAGRKIVHVEGTWLAFERV